MNKFVCFAVLIAINIYFDHVKAGTHSSELNLLPQPPICGGRSKGAKRVFGGVETHINEYRWMAIIIYEDDGPSCAGTLIAEQWVLTAAHCVHNLHVAKVRLGDWDVRTDPDCEKRWPNRLICADPHVDIAVDKAIPHPDFQPNGVYPNDIALLHLSERVNFTDWIIPICLPPARGADINLDAHAGSFMFIAGWGRNERSFNRGSERMLKALVTIWKKDSCQEKLNDEKLNDRQLCVGGSAGSCRGDSGGPLMLLESTTMSQIGIISWGTSHCAAGDLPVVFTQIDAYINWIIEEMKN